MTSELLLRNRDHKQSKGCQTGGGLRNKEIITQKKNYYLTQ